jgi:hypothetical protein
VGRRRQQYLLQFGEDAFVGDDGEACRVGHLHGEREVELDGEPDGPHHAQWVLGETAGPADQTDGSGVQVGDSPEGVHDCLVERIAGDGADGEVPPGQVVAQRIAEHHYRFAAVRRIDLTPKGGNLHGESVAGHPDRAVGLADGVNGADRQAA